MVNPALALMVFAALVAAAALFLWPRRGMLARLSRGIRSTQRILLEDALKYVYTCQSVGRECTRERLAEHLGVSEGRAASLLDRLAESDLVHVGESGVTLAAAGRESALRLVRAHRLWERYLADRTGVPAGEWHAQAERMEHTLTEADTEELSARLGHPRWDPHGDAIPTAGGELPPVEWLSLTGVETGRTVEVVHLEDEPREIYEALLADGIGLGARLEVLMRSEDSVRVRALGREWSIETPAAHNVTVRVLAETARADGPMQTLLDLEAGQVGRVAEISPACQGAQRRRLLDLGVVRGTKIEAEFPSAAGDPVAYLIRGALIALRSEQAAWIRISPMGQSAEMKA